jgi:DNA invertase Pin-like site-specific DNA recombinase
LKAYSYLRFSTPDQLSGDSLRRQTQLAADYAARHGLELDTELNMRDLGVSAFRGKNAGKSGALGFFLRAIEDGLVPEGSLLLVESLDRVSRQSAWQTLPILQQIINNGVTIVTLQDGKSYSQDQLIANQFLLFEALFVLIRANEESATKSRRVRAAWGAKRAKAATQPLTERCPAWLKLRDDRSGFDLIPERAAVVRRVYERAAAGTGQHAIAQQLNREDVPVFGDGKRRGKHWHRSYIAKLLKSEAVGGIYVPHETEHDEKTGKRIRKPQSPVPGYYPAVVEPELYQAIQAMQDGTPNPQRGRNAGLPISNVLAGLAKCPVCDGTMTRVNKGRRGGKPYLVCDRARQGAGCTYHSVHLDQVEQCLIERCEELVATCPAGGDGALDVELQDIEAQIWGAQDGLERLLDAIQAGRTPALAHRVRDVESELEQLGKRERELQHRIAATQGPMLAKRLDELSGALAGLSEDRTPANVVLRQLLSSAVVDWRHGQLVLRWKHGGESELQYGWPDEEALAQMNAEKGMKVQ